MRNERFPIQPPKIRSSKGYYHFYKKSTVRLKWRNFLKDCLLPPLLKTLKPVAENPAFCLMRGGLPKQFMKINWNFQKFFIGVLFCCFSFVSTYLFRLIIYKQLKSCKRSFEVLKTDDIFFSGELWVSRRIVKLFCYVIFPKKIFKQIITNHFRSFIQLN